MVAHVHDYLVHEVERHRRSSSGSDVPLIVRRQHLQPRLTYLSEEACDTSIVTVGAGTDIAIRVPFLVDLRVVQQATS